MKGFILQVWNLPDFGIQGREPASSDLQVECGSSALLSASQCLIFIGSSHLIVIEMIYSYTRSQVFVSLSIVTKHNFF